MGEVYSYTEAVDFLQNTLNIARVGARLILKGIRDGKPWRFPGSSAMWYRSDKSYQILPGKIQPERYQNF